MLRLWFLVDFVKLGPNYGSDKLDCNYYCSELFIGFWFDNLDYCYVANLIVIINSTTRI